jgi:glycosyltransferase involved in cell wall biosynthesis
VRDGDIILIDNYEWLYVFASRVARLSHRLHFVLDYEDGKHLIDKGIYLLLARLAETLGRPLLSAAFLAASGLQERLPKNLPVEFVPGFYSAPSARHQPHSQNRGLLRFIYSGVLDKTRGVDLLLSATNLLPPNGWRLDITGFGELQEQVREHAGRSNNRVIFHATLPPDRYNELVHECDVGLNCQRVSDPISKVTFPSKIFTYFGAGLVVLSSRASEVPSACGDACFYYDEENPASLAWAMQQLIDNFAVIQKQAMQRSTIMERYSFVRTSERLRILFEKAGLI